MIRLLMKTLYVGLLAGALLASQAHAVDSMAVSTGISTEGNELRVALGWQWDKRWMTDGNWHLTGHWELDAGYWRGSGPGEIDIWNVGFTPVFRVVPNDPAHSRWYWEFGVGAQYLSDDHITSKRDFGSRALFGDILGVGARLGGKGGYELGYRFWHLSNANLADENDAINFHEIRLSRRF